MKYAMILGVLMTTLIYGCEEEVYLNQETYDLKVGETVDIYFSLNSCCGMCVGNSDDLQSIEWIDEITVDRAPEDCDGCNTTYAYVFRAIAPGTDTLELRHYVASEYCESPDATVSTFIINVE
jgi:hypothetical protein